MLQSNKTNALIKRPTMAMAKVKPTGKPSSPLRTLPVSVKARRYYIAFGHQHGDKVYYAPMAYQQPKTLRVVENLARLAVDCKVHWVIFAMSSTGQRVIVRKG